MCGIVGAYWFARSDVEPPLIERLSHRGPDGFARYSSPDRRCMLALARLAIVRPDLPPTIARAGSCVAVSTGEIYDYEHLARELGCEASIDTDLVPTLWRTYGPSFLRRLRGPLVSAIYDEDKRELVVLRDAVGKRPLYFARFSDCVMFASEMKAIAAARQLTPRKEFIASTLVAGCADPGVTPYEEIELLAPGAMLRVNAEGTTVTQVDVLGDDVAPSRYEDVRNALNDAAKLRVPRDVRAAVAVGGMDSLIVHAMTDLPAWTIDRDPVEMANARRALKAPMRTLPMQNPSPSGLRSGLWLIESIDSAAAWQMAPATLALGRSVAADGAKVLLTGEGADEAFIGYVWQRPLETPRACIVSGKAVVFADDEIEWLETLRPLLRWRVISRPSAIALREIVEDLSGVPLTGLRFERSGGAGARDVQLDSLRFDMHMLPVVHNDRLMFAAGVETRMPFLDRRVLDCALGLPHDALDLKTATKPVVCKIFESLYGYDAPPKRGFTGLATPNVIPPRTWSIIDGAALDVADGASRDILWRAFLIEELYDVMRATSLAEAEAA